MKFEPLKQEIYALDLGERKNVYECENGSTIYVYRPEEEVKGLTQDYEVELNFQIFLKKPEEEEFRPNHLRVLIDYHLKKESRKNESRKLLSAVERIYEGEDLETLLEEFESYDYEMQIDHLDVTLYLTQLFMVEQAITWGERASRDSKFDPPYLFFMGYLRMVFDEAKEIDKICWGAANQNLPWVGYTKKDNKNRDEYTEEKDRYWYLNG